MTSGEVNHLDRQHLTCHVNQNVIEFEEKFCRLFVAPYFKLTNSSHLFSVKSLSQRTELIFVVLLINAMPSPQSVYAKYLIVHLCKH